jgi:hypothetical protein
MRLTPFIGLTLERIGPERVHQERGNVPGGAPVAAAAGVGVLWTAGMVRAVAAPLLDGVLTPLGQGVPGLRE